MLWILEVSEKYFLPEVPPSNDVSRRSVVRVRVLVVYTHGPSVVLFVRHNSHSDDPSESVDVLTVRHPFINKHFANARESTPAIVKAHTEVYKISNLIVSIGGYGTILRFDYQDGELQIQDAEYVCGF